jgi:hypothetical protein
MSRVVALQGDEDGLRAGVLWLNERLESLT